MSKPVCFPRVEWAQRHNCVFLTVVLADLKDPKISVEPRAVTFEAEVGDGANAKQYKVVIDLYESINPENSAHVVRDRITEFCLKKVDEKFWPRLTQSTEKHHWLKIDFNKWVDEDDSDDEKKGGGGGMPGGMPGMGGGDYDFEEMMKSMGGLGGAGGMGGMGGMPGMGMGGMGMGDKPDLGNLDDEDSDDEEGGAMPDLE